MDSAIIPVSDKDQKLNTTEGREKSPMINSAVRLPEELIEKARTEFGMHGASLAQLVRAAMGIAIGMSRDEALKEYGSVPGTRRKVESVNQDPV